MKLAENINLHVLLICLATACIFILSAAFIAQYGLGLYPCELCLAQRYPYVAVIVIAVLSEFFLKNTRALYVAALLCGGLLFADAAIAFYHSGVEMKIFAGPSACSSNATAGQTLEEMRAAIANAQLVPCDQPQAKFFGLTMATWNGSLALFLAVVTFFVAQKCHKRDKNA